MKLKKKDPVATPGPRPANSAMNPVEVLRREFDAMKLKLSPDETDTDNVQVLWAYFLGGVAQGSAQIAHNAALTLSRSANEELKKVIGEEAPAPAALVGA